MYTLPLSSVIKELKKRELCCVLLPAGKITGRSGDPIELRVSRYSDEPTDSTPSRVALS
jgi:hypothetical protein